MTPFRLLLRGHIASADKVRSDYVYIPFDLPQPAHRLYIRCDYSDPMSSDRIDGGNVIDLGLFDPRGTVFPGTAGFRGWSGSARREFSISRTNATPGYLPGPLPEGRYQIVLGLYRIWAKGADYEIAIEAELGTDSGDVLPPISLGLSKEETKLSSSEEHWLRGDFQCHTFHSDAKGSPAQLVDKARSLGLDFLAVTDHNTVSHHRDLAGLDNGRLLLIPGQEVTTYYGHMNVWGTSRWCDFRCRTTHDMQAIINLAHGAGGVCSINHPKERGPAWEYSFELDVDALEVWQGPWPYHNSQSLARWDQLLNNGRRLPGVGGSDYHCPAAEDVGFLRLGQPTTWVKADTRSVTAVLSAVQRGRVSLSASPTGPRLDLQATSASEQVEMGGVLRVANGAPVEVTTTVWSGHGRVLHLIADGEVVAEQTIVGDEASVITLVHAERYVRAELVGDVDPATLPPESPADLDVRDWRWALSNPIYFIRR